MKHFKSIDAMRGWMAWWVVCQHLIQISGYDVTHRSILMKAATAGGTAVTVFIMISGYVIAHLVISRREDYRSYLLRRFMRIFPLMLVAITLSVLLRDHYQSVVIERPWQPDATRETRFRFETENLAVYLALHLSMLHGLVPSWILPYSSTAILAPAWSLSLEWQFYIVAPVLFVALFRRSLFLNISLCLAASALLVSSTGMLGEGWSEPAFLPMSIGYFMVGILTRLAAERPRPAFFLAPLLLIGVNLEFATETYLGGHAFLALLPFVIWTALVIAILAESGRIASRPIAIASAILNNRFTRFLGECSYSTYLLHVPIFVLALWVADMFGVPKTAFGYLMTMLAALGPLALLSRASYQYVERPGINAADWLLQTLLQRRLPIRIG